MNALLKREYDSLMELAGTRCRDSEELSMVGKAFEMAVDAHGNARLHSGEPYMVRAAEIAQIIVTKVGLGYKSMCAALLYEAVMLTDLSIDTVRSLFGDKVAGLIEGLINLNNILEVGSPESLDDTDLETQNAESFRRVLLSMGNDVRVVLIKLAGCLYVCRHIEKEPEEVRKKILTETMDIFIPLAHRLGLYSIKSELENIWLRHMQPRSYEDIENRLDKDSAARIRQLDAFIEPISSALTKKGFVFEIKKRAKTPYSIWHKMKTKHVPFEQIYDLYAVRIIFDPSAFPGLSERDQAFSIFSTLTSLYKDKPSRMRDWIGEPKNNGYEALHCTLMSKSGFWVEAQIRSRRMDDIAEKGIAAHWAYKNDGYLSESDSTMDSWLTKIQEILNSDNLNSLELLDLIQEDIVTREVVVFTPKGDQKSISKGSTALDFAYKVHTNVGNHAIAAKINMRLAPLSHVLKSGDQVEIITARKATPKIEWLTFLHTRSAKHKLMDWIRAHDPEMLAEAEKMLAQEPSVTAENARIPLMISLQGVDRPGLQEEIESALKRIDGIEDVVISDL